MRAPLSCGSETEEALRGSKERQTPHEQKQGLAGKAYQQYCSHMGKTTLMIDDRLMVRLREEAARQGRTISELVESALRLLPRRNRPSVELPPLPSFDGDGALVEVADRDALYRAMEGR